LFLDALFDEALLVLDISPSWEVLDRLFARNGKNGFGGGFEFGGLSRERAILIHGGEYLSGASRSTTTPKFCPLRLAW